MNGVEKFLAAMRAVPVNEGLYMDGQCYNLFRILRTLFPEAKPYYSPEEGHVYTRIGNGYYDIRGRHYRLPADLELLDHDCQDKPHRWPKQDKRRLLFR